MSTESTPLDPGAVLGERIGTGPRRRIGELRGQIGRLQAELDDRLAAEATVEITLTGEGGGSWYLNLRQGDLTVDEQPSFPPLIRVRQSRGDWEALVRAGGGSGPAGDLTRSRIERLRGLEGAIEFSLATDAGEHSVVVQFGQTGTAAPRCTVSLRAVDAARMQTGELPPQVAFMQGLVRLQGDAAFAMQVAAALLAGR